MRLNRQIKIQLAIFAVIAIVAAAISALQFAKIPAMVGIGRYEVTVELPRAGGLYQSANVTYRGVQVGKVESVGLTDSGTVQAVLSLKSGIEIPSNLRAEVHSQSAIGEQYLALLPNDATSTPLRNGDTIAMQNTSVPPDIDKILDATVRGLQAIPQDNLKTVVDESYTAIGGLGPELSRLVNGAVTLAIDARSDLDSLTMLVDDSAPVLDSQADTADSIQAWAANLRSITGQLRDQDGALAGVIDNGAAAAAEARALVERLQPTLPVILNNLVSVGQILITYQPSLEQLLVLVPHAVAFTQSAAVPNIDSKSPYAGGFLDFNLNINLPPPCTTGFLPASQRRTPAQVDAPDRPAGDLYCRVPQDSPFNVRGARNIPCLNKPGKRAPTANMCESDEEYVPLNDGFNWKGDPNATITGQGVPQFPSGTEPPAPAASPAPPSAESPLAVAEYDPSSGSYVGPDGRVYTQSDLAQDAPTDKSWQHMLLPPN